MARPRRRQRPRRGRSSDPFLRQAELESRVRFGPESGGLRQLVREARRDLETGIKAEEGAAEGIKAAADHARPEIRKVYGDAGRAYDEADSDVQKALSGLGGGANEQRGVLARESANARRRLAEGFARADTELGARKVDAEAGRAFAVRNHASTYTKEKGKLDTRRRELRGEIGAFKLATAGDLREAARKAQMDEQQFSLGLAREERQSREGSARIKQSEERLGLQRRGQDLSARDRRAQRELTKRGQDRRGRGKGGAQSLTPSARRSYRQKYQKAVNIIRTDPKWSPKRSQEFIKALSATDIPNEIARAAVERVKYGGASRGLARQVRSRYGFSVHLAKSGPKRPSRRPARRNPLRTDPGALGIRY